MYFKQKQGCQWCGINATLASYVFAFVPITDILPLTEAAHWLICSNGAEGGGGGGDASHETLARATWAHVMYPGRVYTVCDGSQAWQCIYIYGMGGSVFVCVCMKNTWMSCGRSDGGITRAPCSSLRKERGGGRGGEDPRRKDGWGDAVLSPLPTSSFTFFCTWVGEGCVCLVFTCMHEAHSWNKLLSYPLMDGRFYSCFHQRWRILCITELSDMFRICKG